MRNPLVNFVGRFRCNAKAFRRDDAAATAVEFALLALPFFLIVGGILQISVVFLSTQILESAVHDATRNVRTGQIQRSSGTLETFRAQICDRLFGLYPDCSRLHLRVVEITNFESASVVVPTDAACTQDCDWTIPQIWLPGVGKSTVLVQAFYRYPITLQFGALGMSNMADGSRLIGTATVFQNEPF